MTPPSDLIARFAALREATAGIAPDEEFLQQLEEALGQRQSPARSTTVVYLERWAPLIAASASLIAMPLCTYSVLLMLHLPDSVWELLLEGLS